MYSQKLETLETSDNGYLDEGEADDLRGMASWPSLYKFCSYFFNHLIVVFIKKGIKILHCLIKMITTIPTFPDSTVLQL